VTALILIAWYVAAITGEGSGRVVGPFADEQRCERAAYMFTVQTP
jgi:hypothetical protein